MTELDKLNNTINAIAGSSKQAQLRFVECKSVDWDSDSRTMTAIGIGDGGEYVDVMLGFGYMDVKPKVGSVCLIGIVEGQETLTFLINAEEVELVDIRATQIEYNGKAYDSGWAVVPELKKQLDIMSDRIDGIISAIQNGEVVAKDGGAVLLGSFKTGLAKITQKENFSKIENRDILH